jgi:hypothetical protein
VLGEKIRCEPYSEAKFRQALHAARAVAAEMPRDFAARLAAICAEAGVALVFVPELPKTRVSGATRWLTPEKAMIQQSLRHRRDDQFWFTFFHEAGHVLLHGKREVFIDGAEREQNDCETEADRFASDFLIPASELRKLPRPPFPSRRFARLRRRSASARGFSSGACRTTGYFRSRISMI